MISAESNSTSPPIRRALVVEDDFITRRFFHLCLERRGWQVFDAASVPAAQRHITVEGVHSFDCVVTDYRMPDHTGLDLLDWLKAHDPSLATIIVTAEGEKRLVEESLRNGAADFLDKPVKAEALVAAVEKAAAMTLRQRQLLKTQSDVQEVGRAQKRLVSTHLGDGPVRIELCFHPMFEAGGDFLSRFQMSGNRVLLLATDVSGHDITAAYVSAYFHGIVRGMMEQAASVGEVFEFFNRYLIHEWSRREPSGTAHTVTSIAAVSLLLDLERSSAAVLASGFPLPVLVPPNGALSVLGPGGSPLGWFDENPVVATTHAIPPGSDIYVWTDGLEELAEALQVAPAGLGYALLEAKARGVHPPWLAHARDDILVARIRVRSAEALATESFRPLLIEDYAGSEANRIDAFQERWRRTVAFALPGIGEAKLFDVLLATREVLLNALQHGCAGDAGQRATVQMSFEPTRKLLRVRIDDPGPGHDFDLSRERDQSEDCSEKHCGLVLVKYLPDLIRTERRGAAVELDFSLEATRPPGGRLTSEGGEQRR